MPKGTLKNGLFVSHFVISSFVVLLNIIFKSRIPIDYLNLKKNIRTVE